MISNSIIRKASKTLVDSFISSHHLLHFRNLFPFACANEQYLVALSLTKMIIIIIIAIWKSRLKCICCLNKKWALHTYNWVDVEEELTERVQIKFKIYSSLHSSFLEFRLMYIFVDCKHLVSRVESAYYCIIWKFIERLCVFYTHTSKKNNKFGFNSVKQKMFLPSDTCVTQETKIIHSR